MGNPPTPASRYGPAEIFGRDIAQCSPRERRELIETAATDAQCPFTNSKCTKKGGVCSLRQYEAAAEHSANPVGGSVVATCPNRFRENDIITEWVGDRLLGSKKALEVWELGFLLAEPNSQENSKEDIVGRIDRVLVHPNTTNLKWCALETQAVYFSGPALGPEISRIAASSTLPFPAKIRRPDFRSSGPKRLMPQLQIKVPTLSRWGIKMAVVVDAPFWKSLGKMEVVSDVSNSDIAWFIVEWKEVGQAIAMTPGQVVFTTLSDAVKGLTGGIPVSQGQFEKLIRAKL